MTSTNFVINEVKKQVNETKRLDLGNNKLLLALPDNLVFFIDKRDLTFAVVEGFGHEPEVVKRMGEFINVGDIYVEVGANYGIFLFK